MNPFRILGLQKDAGKREVLLGAASALKKREYSALEIAAAQKKLLEAEGRFELDFLYFVDPSPQPLQGEISFSADPACLVQSMGRLSVFDQSND